MEWGAGEGEAIKKAITGARGEAREAASRQIPADVTHHT